MINDEIVQGSPEWFAARLGKLTSSRINDATAKIKSGEAASRRTYRDQLLSERRTGIGGGSDLSAIKHVKWGTDCEPFARQAIEVELGCLVKQVGFVDHPTIPMAGCSPDGFIGTDHIIEIKCPASSTHIGYLKNPGMIPNDYKKQVLWILACTQRRSAIFCSFDPRWGLKDQMLLIHYEPHPSEIKELEEEASKFLAEVAADELWLLRRAMTHIEIRV